MTALLTQSPTTGPSTAATASTPPPMLAGVVDVQLYRVTLEQYHRAIRHGIFSKADHVELLDGLLVQKMPEDPAHAALIDIAAATLRAVLPSGWIVRPDHPITTAGSEPEPDVVVARGTHRDYMQRHPGPADCSLVVEIANSSLARDRGFKRRLYARAGVPVYWIVVLPERAVEVYADPSGPAAEPGYATVRRYGDSESVPVVVDGREVGTVAVADLLP